MAAKKQVYVHFDGASYVSAKSEVLKTQMETLYLKKLVRNLILTREKKRHYNLMLKQTYHDLKKRIEKLDSLVPVNKEVLESTPRVARKVSRKAKPKSSETKKIQESKEPEHDSIEDELLKIKAKLDQLNRV